MGVRMCVRAHALSVVAASVVVYVSVEHVLVCDVCDCQWEGV